MEIKLSELQSNKLQINKQKIDEAQKSSNEIVSLILDFHDVKDVKAVTISEDFKYIILEQKNGEDQINSN